MNSCYVKLFHSDLKTITFIFLGFFILSCKQLPDGVPDQAKRIGAGFWRHTGKSRIRYFYPDGILYQEGQLQNGQLNGRWISYSHDGIKTTLGQYENNLRVGQWRFYDSAKNLYLILHYAPKPRRMDYLLLSGNKVGNENGKYERYYPDHIIEEKGYYSGGSLHGMVQHYYPTGKLAFKGLYKNDKKEGHWIHYHANGSIKREEHWKANQLDGMLRNYYFEGQLYNQAKYSNGVLIEATLETYPAYREKNKI